MEGWREMFRFRLYWGNGEWGFHIGWVWIAILAGIAWWAIS